MHKQRLNAIKQLHRFKDQFKPSTNSIIMCISALSNHAFQKFTLENTKLSYVSKNLTAQNIDFTNE